MNRRNFLKTTTTSLMAASLLPGLPPAYAASTADGPGISLFLIIHQLEKDFPGTLKQIADMGYRKVESIGAMGRDPKYVKQMLDDHGLVTPSQHLAPANLYNIFLGLFSNKITFEELVVEYLKHFHPSNIEAVVSEGIERAKAMGQKYICLPIVFKEQLQSREAVYDICEALDTAGKMCTRENLVFAFHNHAVEFEPVDGLVPYDTFLERTNPDTVKFEMDAYWITKAGKDPLEYFKNYPNRYRECHIKDIDKNGEMTDIGKGEIDFESFIRVGKAAGVENFFLEYDRSPHPLKSAQIAYDQLHRYF